MNNFLPQKDELTRNIQEQAAKLYAALNLLSVDSLGMPDHCLYYFKASHLKRLFFSIQTSAHLLYRSIKLTNKPVTDIIIMDYGAGVGTLYLLAKMIGCKKVIYNDHLEEWKNSAAKIAEAIDIKIDEYLVGDIHDTLAHLKSYSIDCDIITSRNVIEHIYKLSDFYEAISRDQPNSFIYSSTTANYYNPAAHIKHVLWHKKWEKVYKQQRLSIISSMSLQLNKKELGKLASSTRGIGGSDIKEAVHNYLSNHTLPDPSVHYTNTCDPENGVWAEHLLTFGQYRRFIGEERFAIDFAPGFWDTRYTKKWKNFFSTVLNGIIRGMGTAGIILAPFIYVIARPKKK